MLRKRVEFEMKRKYFSFFQISMIFQNIMYLLVARFQLND